MGGPGTRAHSTVLYIRYLFRANLLPTQCESGNFVRNDSNRMAVTGWQCRLHSNRDGRSHSNRAGWARGQRGRLRECGSRRRATITQCGCGRVGYTVRLQATGYGYASAGCPGRATQCGYRVRSTCTQYVYTVRGTQYGQPGTRVPGTQYASTVPPARGALCATQCPVALWRVAMVVLLCTPWSTQ